MNSRLIVMYISLVTLVESPYCNFDIGYQHEACRNCNSGSHLAASGCSRLRYGEFVHRWEVSRGNVNITP
jgi:hypothetical protein